MKLILRDLFVKPWKDQPLEFIDKEMCIYKITNIINGKCYIGQTSWLYGRFVSNGWLSHKTEFQEYCKNGLSSRKLYNALKSYHCKNFTVEILESDLANRHDLNEREVYWISQFDSFNNGYNMTSGGDNRENITSEKSREVNRLNHGGVLSWNTKEAISKSLKTREQLYGESMGACHSQEVYDKRRLKYKEEYGDEYGPLHTRYAVINQTTSRLIKNIYSILDNLKHLNLELTPDNYYYNSGYSQLNKVRYHLTTVLNHLDDLRDYEEWTNDLDSLFLYFKSNKSKYKLK